MDKVSDAADVDGWIGNLAENSFFVSCSSGTTGKSAMLVASQKDMDWCKKEAVATYSWGSGVKPAQDRRMFGIAATAHVPRNLATGEAYTAALQDPNYERWAYPVPPITVGGLTQMVVLRKSIADGTAKPEDIAAFEKISAVRQKAVDDAVGITAQAVVEARRSKLHVSGLWAGLYNVAKAVREMGYSAKAVYWRGGDASVEQVLYRPQYFDKIVAWGGGDAINNVIQYLGPGFQLVSFDPKTSISMVGC